MRLLMLFAALCLPLGSQAMPATSKDGYVACTSERWLNDMVAFVAAGDRQNFGRYVEMKRCVVMQAGLHVTVVESPGLLGGKTGFIYNGYRFWALREALNYGSR